MPEEHGGVTVHCSTQHPTEVQHLVAHMLHMPAAMVTCECRRMGGAFGGKESQAAQWACLAALAAHVTGRPAKCRLDRDEDMIMTGKRHDFRVDYKAGFDAKGAHHRRRCRFPVALRLFGGSVQRHLRPHHVPCGQCLFLSRRAHRHAQAPTNTVSNTAFRGFGGPQGMLFAERMMEAIAIKTGLDPLDVRKLNLYTDEARRHALWHEGRGQHRARRHRAARDIVRLPRAPQGDRGFQRGRTAVLKKGISLTPVKFGISFTLTHLNQAGALVHVYTDGSVHLNHGGTEMGQGLYTKVAQVVAEEFGIDASAVRITATTTGKVPNTSATAASSGADLNGMAAKQAAATIKARLIDFAAQAMEGAEVAHPLRGRPGADRQPVASPSANWPARPTWRGSRCPPPASTPRRRSTGTGPRRKGRPFFYFAYGAACSEVTIDTLTGEMRVDRVDILHDVGRSLNPALDIGQIEGGFVQGMGWLTTEELVYDAARAGSAPMRPRPTRFPAPPTCRPISG